MPYSDEDCARCLMLTDHFITQAELTRAGEALKAGVDARLHEPAVAQALAMYRSIGLHPPSLPPAPLVQPELQPGDRWLLLKSLERLMPQVQNFPYLIEVHGLLKSLSGGSP